MRLQHFTKKYAIFSQFYPEKWQKVVGVIILLLTPISFADDFNQFYAQLEPQELILAESVLQKSIDTQPTNYNLQSDLAFIQYYLGKPEDALTLFQELSKLDAIENKTGIFYGLALVHHELHHAPESLLNIIKAYDLAPESYAVVKLYADISHAMNLHQATIDNYTKTETVNVALPEVTSENDQIIAYTFKNALNAYKENNLEAARKQLETLLEDNPDDIDAMVLLAFIMYREGDSVEAERIFSELASRNEFDENSDVLYGLALSQRNLGKNVEAFENILRAIVAETTREDLLALYRSLALQLSIAQENPQDSEPASTTPEIMPETPIESASGLTLKDVIADVTKSENLDINQ